MPRPRLYASDADRVRAHRERHDTVQLCVDIPRDLAGEFETYLKFKDLAKSEVIAKLLRTQLLRKR
jgi:hypothetical protein